MGVVSIVRHEEVKRLNQFDVLSDVEEVESCNSLSDRDLNFFQPAGSNR